MRSVINILIVAVFCYVLADGQTPRALERDKATITQTDKRIALVIGNGAYTHAPPLKNPANDARDMAVTLKALGFEVASGVNVSQKDMKRLIREFGLKLKGGGSGLFYYAGHGIQSKGRNYLIPVDADIQSEAEVEDAGVDVSLVLRFMDEAQNGLNFVILDACRNNPFLRSFRSAENGLAQVDAPTGTLIAYATAPGTVASDGTDENGLYTSELLKQMRVPGQSATDMFMQVRTEVIKKTVRKQVPWESSSLVGSFYFSGVPNKTSDSGFTALAIQYSRWEGMLKRQEYAAMISETSSELLRNHSNVVALRMRISAYYFSDQETQALNDANAVLRLVPSPSTEYEFDAHCVANTHLERQDEAISACSAVIRMNPSFASAFRYRGDAYSKKKQVELGISDYTRAIELDPSDPYVYTDRGQLYEFKQQLDLAIADYTKSLALDPKYLATWEIRGGAYIATGRFELAIADFSEAIRLDPKDGSTYSNRCVAYDKMGKYDLAIADCTKSIELDPKVAAAYQNRGLVLDHMKQYDRAIFDYTKAVGLDPKLAAAYRNRGATYGHMKQYDLAIADYTKAIELDPKSSTAYNNRANAYNYKEQFDNAISDYSKAIEYGAKGRLGTAYFGRGDAWEEKQQFDQAFADYSNAIEDEPTLPFPFLRRGKLLMKRSQYELAIADFSKTIELGLENSDVYNSRGAARYQIRQFDPAITDFSKSIELDPEDPETFRNRAYAYEAKGESGLAAKDRLQAEKLEGNVKP